MKLKKILSGLLLSLIVLLPSCASGTTSDPYTETDLPSLLDTTPTIEYSESSGTYDQILSKRIDRDFKGKKFRIATDDTEFILSNNGESLLGKEHYLRNSAVEKKYNVKISLTDESGTATIADRIRTEALSGNDYCDLIILESTRFQALASSKSLINVRSVPYLDINADFYFEKSLEATTLGDFSYGIAGDFIYKPEDVTVLFFNKTLLAQAPLPDIYSLVESNQWDVENFILYAEEVYSLAKENGRSINGILSTLPLEDLVKVFWAASGMDFMKNEYGSRPELIYNNENTIKFVDQFRNTFFRSIAFTSGNMEQSAVSSFANGDGLFLIASLDSASQIVGRGIDWGIVPIPKTDINQKKYYSYANQSYSLAGFSKGTSDLNLSGIITSALFDTSKGLSQKYTVQNFLNMYFTSPKDAQMMQQIIETPYYDPVEFFGQIDTSFTAATQTLLYRTAANEKDFYTLYAQYTKMLDKYLDTIF